MKTKDRLRVHILALLAAATGAAAFAAPPPKALDGVSGGLWEIEGLPGTKSGVRQCVADPLKLATVEHEGAACNVTVLGESGSTVRLNYQCGPAGFGQGNIKQITPRSLRVEVTGIADAAPYGFVVQARRVGDCPNGSERGH